MPELPEVETVRRGITPHLEGQTISDVIIRHKQLRWPVPARIKRLLPGETIQKIERRAKYLLITVSKGTLILHLGMSGTLRIVDAKEPIKKHDHFDMVMKNGICLRFNDPRRFGAILWEEGEIQQHELINKLGPEPLSKAFNTEQLYQLSRKRSVPVKQFIMDNQVVVGVGNIYASESLFMAGIDPRRKANSISRQRYQKLCDSIKEVLKAAIKQGGTTLKDFTRSDGRPGYFAQQLNVYGRTGEECPSCGRAIKQITQGQRSSYFCTTCQR